MDFEGNSTYFSKSPQNKMKGKEYSMLNTFNGASNKRVSFRSMNNSPIRDKFNSDIPDLISSGRITNNNNKLFFSKRKYLKNPVERFMPDFVSCSGVNKKENLKILMNKEIIKPPTSDRNTIYIKPILNFENRKDKFSLNFSLKCPNENNLPKYEQYTQLNFPYRNKETADNYKRIHLKTDNIAIKVPNPTELNKTNYNGGISFLEMKSKFNSSTESGSSFSPRNYDKSINNKSSVNYNIISVKGKEGFSDNTAGVLEPKLLFRKKGVGEYSDLTKTYAINPGNIYLNTYKAEPMSFKHYNGIFTHLYDSAIRNGGLSMPFRKDNKNIRK